MYRNYLAKTDQRTKLLDAFMAFLVVVGALQFVYCVIGGNFVSVLGFLCVFLGAGWMGEREAKEEEEGEKEDGMVG